MTNDTNKSTDNTQQTNTTTNAANQALDPIAQLEALRANTVSKEEYERVVAERNQMFSTLAHQPTTKTTAPTAPTKIEQMERAKELRAKLYDENCDLNNLDYWKDTLELRKIIIDNGGRDPFLPWGKDNAVDDDDRKIVDRVVEGVQSCIDYADGDSVLFTNELQRITIDTPQARVAAAANRR